MTEVENRKQVAPPPNSTLSELLLNRPLGDERWLSDGFTAKRVIVQGTVGGPSFLPYVNLFFNAPVLKQFCPNSNCHALEPTRWVVTDGPRKEEELSQDINAQVDFVQIEFTCQACNVAKKYYFVRLCFHDTGWDGGQEIKNKWSRVSVLATKVGEFPGFVPVYPKPLLNKLTDDLRKLFFQGIKCENNGCGIGAFAYYRRIVEDAKHLILNKLIEFAIKGSLSSEVDSLKLAKDERQFAKAVQLARSGINEFTYGECCADLLLLHEITSGDIHAGSDEEAADAAREVRDLLLGVMRRLDQLKDDNVAEKKAREALRKRAASRKAAP
ncbi:MAG: hypothetical protein H6840_09835 [Planctomycetes bacterium]|nr:hypothetical protein [Planctomycetota bacterium]